MAEGTSKIEVGTRLGTDLTVLGIVDDGGDEPVYLVWHHKFWCPMLCKLGRSKEATRREADIMLALAHPNVVRCFGVHKSTFMLMEYLEGPNLHEVLKLRPKRRVSIDDALRISIYVGSALSHIHDRGILHLDVKPSNIVLVNARPVLCDFGIARWQTAPRPNGMRGTDGYVAPEECELKAVTPAADVFGLGVTLYQLLTGGMPFPKKSDGEPYPQLLHPPLSIRKHHSGVALGLERLVLSCLSRDPKSRPKLASLLPTLHQFIRGGPPMWPVGFDPK